jgi:flagellar biosynthesis/type III secretory pathway protein FliH
MGVLTDARQQHDYRRCRDEDCQRYACRIWREGIREGYQRGAAAGYAQGHAAGYAEGHTEGRAGGYAEGAASCGER